MHLFTLMKEHQHMSLHRLLFSDVWLLTFVSSFDFRCGEQAGAFERLPVGVSQKPLPAAKEPIMMIFILLYVVLCRF